MTPREIAGIVRGSGVRPWPERQVTGVSTDSRSVGAGDLFFAVRGPRFDGHDYVDAALARGAAGCVVDSARLHHDDPGIVRVPDVVAALGHLAAHHRDRAPATVIAITGSNGKTTTKNMLGHVLATAMPGRASIRSFNNHLGVPLTLLSSGAEDRFLVVEIGTNAPGEVAALAALTRPDIGVLTSIGAAHLEGLGGVEGVRREKISLFDHVRAGGSAVASAAAVSGMSVLPRSHELRWLTFGDHPEADIRITDIAGDLDSVRGWIEGRHELRLGVPGAHNAVNAVGVFTVCRIMGMSPEAILAGLATFRASPSRLEVRRVGDLILIDDCYNANPASMQAAIDIMEGIQGRRRVLVAGEMAELGDASEHLHRQVGRAVVEAGIEVLLAVGEPARPVVEGAGGTVSGRGPEARHYRELADAAAELAEVLRPGDVVLCKGSRKAGLEALVGRIECLFGEAHPGASPGKPGNLGGPSNSVNPGGLREKGDLPGVAPGR